MDDLILLGHGSGGRLMHELIRSHLAPAFEIGELGDAAALEGVTGRLAFTTDSYVVSPIFFPGGNIGDLAVNGTVNDLAVSGARPLYLTAGFIIEEGFALDDLLRIVSSMAAAARRADVRVVAGDIKVVEKGKGDGVFINTSGVGLLPEGLGLSASKIETGDKILISGSVGRHGIAVMAGRHGLSFDPPVLSDTAPLNGLVEAVAARLLRTPTPLTGCPIRVMRDPTRGGLATALKEFALECNLCLTVYEKLIPVEPGVRGACELLGLDPLYVANEGVLLAVLKADVAEYSLNLIRGHPFGGGAAIIGEVMPAPSGEALLGTEIGGSRVLDMLRGQQLPRIC